MRHNKERLPEQLFV